MIQANSPSNRDYFSSFSVKPEHQFKQRRRMYTLTSDLVFHTRKYGIITVPKGFQTDFASIPPVFFTLFPPDGRYLEAAILHDYYYDNAIETKDKADELFLMGMNALGVKMWRKYLMYWAVRRFGKGKYT